MNSSISSIDIKYCYKTKSNILNSIQLCKNCSKIPFPPYRNYKKSEIVFCRECYLSEFKTLDDTVFPSETEYNVMNQIIISCMYSDKICNQKFNIQNIQNLFSHQKKCKIFHNKNIFMNNKRQRSINKTFKNKIEIIQVQINDQIHSSQQISKKLEDTIKTLKSNMGIIEDHLSHQTISCQQNSENSNKTTTSLLSQMIDLKQSVEGQNGIIFLSIIISILVIWYIKK